MSLIICKQKIKRQGLQNLPIPTPDANSRWKPLAYHLQAKLAKEALNNHGYEIVEEDHGIAKPAIMVDGKFQRVNYSEVQGPCTKIKRGETDHQLWWRHYFGGFALTHPNVVGDRRRIVLGMRNSYDQSLAASFIVGSHMLVCENMEFGAEIKIARKNTLNIERDLPAMIDDAVSQIMGHWRNMTRRVEAYKEFLITEEKALAILVHLVDVEALSKKDIYDCICLFRNPASGADAMVNQDDFDDEKTFKDALEARKEEFRQEFGTIQNGKGTLWNLYNAFTYVLKGTSLDDLPQRTMMALAYLDSVSDFKAPAVSVDVVEVEASPNEQAQDAQQSLAESQAAMEGGSEDA